jgi:glutathione S-transferase
VEALDQRNPPGWLDRLWETAAFYEFFAHEYGFLPSDVDEERQMIIELFPAIRALKVEMHNDERRRREANG